MELRRHAPAESRKGSGVSKGPDLSIFPIPRKGTAKPLSTDIPTEDVPAATAREKERSLEHRGGVGALGGWRSSWPQPRLLCDAPLNADRFRVSGRQHPVQHRHADGSLGLLGRKAAGAQTRSDQRLVSGTVNLAVGRLVRCG